jgi:site-specific DNA-adenine methylase
MDYFRSPLNWVGNKYKYLSQINKLISDKTYSKVVEAFLGTGNILLNIDVNADVYIGNDKNKLTPQFYNVVRNNNYNYTLDKFNEILDNFNKFTSKDDYYKFRDHWNQKYLSNNFDYEFIYETVMLLKMCSNSMVRFNPTDGYFNQGFRGVTNKNGFFTETKKCNCVNGLNLLSQKLKERNYIFYNQNFVNLTELGEDDNLIILDPPYIAVTGIYDTDYNESIDDILLNYIANTNNDFIMFNYIERDNIKHDKLIDFINKHNFDTIEINNKTLSGQGRTNTKDVKEAIIYKLRSV